MKYNNWEECPIAEVLQIDSLFTWFRNKFSSGYKFGGEVHDFIEVVCVMSGSAGITADKDVHILTAGQMVIHEPNEFHNIWAADGEYEVLICTFKASKFPRISGVYSLYPDELKEWGDIFTVAKQIFTFEGIGVSGILDGKTAQASAVVKRLESALIRIMDADGVSKQSYKGGSAQNYIKIVTEMENNLSAARTSEQLAELCNMSVSSLEKTVRKYANAGAMELFNIMKIKHACELLQAGNSVKDVAYSLGFANPYYFSTSFKKHTGVSPSKWARR